jgi:4-hydroxy-2-oxoglutarate aldolase
MNIFIDPQILAGSASFLLSALHVGAVGGICALANALPNQVCRLQELYRQGDSARAEASELQRRLVGPNAAVTKTFGVAGMKTAMDLYGFYGGPTRRPLLPLEADEKEKLRVAFKSSGFL